MSNLNLGLRVWQDRPDVLKEVSDLLSKFSNNVILFLIQEFRSSELFAAFRCYNKNQRIALRTIKNDHKIIFITCIKTKFNWIK